MANPTLRSNVSKGPSLAACAVAKRVGAVFGADNNSPMGQDC